jgi:hypothetical protein
MRTTRWNQPRCVLAVAGLAVAALTAPGLPAASAAVAPGPALRLASSPPITCAATGTMTQSSRPSRRTQPARAG